MTVSTQSRPQPPSINDPREGDILEEGSGTFIYGSEDDDDGLMAEQDGSVCASALRSVHGIHCLALATPSPPCTVERKLRAAVCYDRCACMEELVQAVGKGANTGSAHFCTAGLQRQSLQS